MSDGPGGDGAGAAAGSSAFCSLSLESLPCLSSLIAGELPVLAHHSLQTWPPSSSPSSARCPSPCWCRRWAGRGVGIGFTGVHLRRPGSWKLSMLLHPALPLTCLINATTANPCTAASPSSPLPAVQRAAQGCGHLRQGRPARHPAAGCGAGSGRRQRLRSGGLVQAGGLGSADAVLVLAIWRRKFLISVIGAGSWSEQLFIHLGSPGRSHPARPPPISRPLPTPLPPPQQLPRPA